MNRKPDRALATLQSTRVAELSNDMRDQRLLLKSRAMSSLGRHDLALELITNINSREATRLRVDILWAARRWREAGEQIELLYGDRWRQFAPLNDTERSDILRAAIGFALSEESIGLGRLREKYQAKFADGPDRRAFDVVTAPIGTNGIEFQDIAKKVASVDTLDAFLRDLRTRYPDAAAVSPAVPQGEGASTTAPPDKRKRRWRMPPRRTGPAKPGRRRLVQDHRCRRQSRLRRRPTRNRLAQFASPKARARAR